MRQSPLPFAYCLLLFAFGCVVFAIFYRSTGNRFRSLANQYAVGSGNVVESTVRRNRGGTWLLIKYAFLTSDGVSITGKTSIANGDYKYILNASERYEAGRTVKIRYAETNPHLNCIEELIEHQATAYEGLSNSLFVIFAAFGAFAIYILR